MTPDTNDTAPVILEKGGPRKNTRSRYWFGTLNNYTEDDFLFLDIWLKAEADDYAFQEELGKDGTPHIQFCIKFKNARYFNSVKKNIPKAHIEMCKNWAAARNYCLKDDTNNGRRREMSKKKIFDPLDTVELYNWQTEICNLMDTEADNRTIYWYWENNGCVGKTTLARHLCLKYPKQVLYLSGKKADILFGVYSFLEEKDNDLRMVILDFSRSLENYISWDAIESLKNGIFYNTKYKSAMCVFDYIHVICFANFEPDIGKLSLDRWKITNIGNGDSSDDW